MAILLIILTVKHVILKKVKTDYRFVQESF